jgi:hypothetical protein
MLGGRHQQYVLRGLNKCGREQWPMSQWLSSFLDKYSLPVDHDLFQDINIIKGAA